MNLKISMVTYTRLDNIEPVRMPALVGEGHTKPLHLTKEILEGDGNWGRDNQLSLRMWPL